NLWDEYVFIPLAAAAFHQHKAREHTRNKRNAEVDENTLGDAPHGDGREIDIAEAQADRGWDYLDKKPRVEAVKQHLEHAVERHQPGRVLAVAPGQVVPDDHHRDTARQADQDQPHQ